MSEIFRLHPTTIFSSEWNVDDVNNVNSETLDPAVPPTSYIQDLQHGSKTGPGVGTLIYNTGDLPAEAGHVVDWWRLKYYVTLLSGGLRTHNIRINGVLKTPQDILEVAGWNTITFAGGESRDAILDTNRIVLQSAIGETTDGSRVSEVYIEGQSTLAAVLGYSPFGLFM